MNKNNTIRKSMSLEAIFKDAAEKSLLTNEQEVELASRIKQGDEQALSTDSLCYFKFIVYFTNCPYDFHEMKSMLRITKTRLI